MFNKLGMLVVDEANGMSSLWRVYIVIIDILEIIIKK